MSRRRLVTTALAALVALTVGVVLGVSVLSSDDSSPGRSTVASTTSHTPPDTGPPPVPAGWVQFRDARRGFSLWHPPGWRRLKARDRGISLLLRRDQTSSLLARASSVGLNVSAQTLPIVRGLTDRLVRADATVSMLAEPAPVTLGGMPGYRYVYTFGRGTATRGAHLHYFLFHRGRMITLVFQAMPAARFGAADAQYEQIASTIRPIDP